MLKVRIDDKGDYLDYLRPFIIEAFSLEKIGKVDTRKTADLLKEKFGLLIPERSIEIILKRFAKSKHLTLKHGLFFLSDSFPRSNLQAEKNKAKNCIDAVIIDIKKYWKKKNKDLSEEDVINSLLSVLSDFATSTLSAYLRNTVIPDDIIPDAKDKNRFLVGKYLLDTYQSNRQCFENFLVLLKGHMIANAILCPDIMTKGTYKKVTFYFDTPLILELLDFDGDYKKEQNIELIDLLKQMDGKIAVFEHTLKEVKEVLRAEFNSIYYNKVGNGIRGFNREEKSPSDIQYLISTLEEQITEKEIEIKTTPPYSGKFNIDEREFESLLKNIVGHKHENAKNYDIKSVTSIYEIRKGRKPNSLESCNAVFVTSNSAYAKAAFQYGKKFEEGENVSSVITDFFLGNITWLKAPMKASLLPQREILAYSYASMNPSNEFLEKFLKEIDKLQKDKIIPDRKHQLLRSYSVSINDKLMVSTMGSDKALSRRSIIEIANQIESDIKKEEQKKYEKERSRREDIEKKNIVFINEKREQKALAHDRCNKKIKIFKGFLYIIIFLILALPNLYTNIDFIPSEIIKFLFKNAFLLISIIDMLTVGYFIKPQVNKLSNLYKKRCIKKEEKYLGYKLD